MRAIQELWYFSRLTTVWPLCCLWICHSMPLQAQNQPIPDGVYMIQVLSTHKYLAIEQISQANGARLVQWDYANQDNHKFVITKNRDGATYTIRAKHSGKVLDVLGASTANSAPLVQWDSNPSAESQQWYILQYGHDYYLMGKASQKRIRLQGGLQQAQNGVLLELSTNYPEQALSFEKFNDSAFENQSPKPSFKTKNNKIN
ncbi:MAG: RICIN domain-containing protein [Spirosomataceae bacterium]